MVVLAQSSYAAYLGVSPYHLSGTGTGMVGTGFRRFPVHGALSIDVTLALFDESETSIVQGIRVNRSSSLALPEVSLELGRRFGQLRPFLGIGGGAAISLHGRQSGGLTLHGLLGLSVRVSRAVSLGAMAKVRSIKPFRGSMADLMLGVEIGP